MKVETSLCNYYLGRFSNENDSNNPRLLANTF